jgi:hypothetical protein
MCSESLALARSVRGEFLLLQLRTHIFCMWLPDEPHNIKFPLGRAATSQHSYYQSVLRCICRFTVFWDVTQCLVKRQRRVGGTFFLNSHSGVESILGSTPHVGRFWPIVSDPGDCEDGEFGGIRIGRGDRSTRRKPVPAPLCPPQIPLDQTRARTRAAAVGSQLLTCYH